MLISNRLFWVTISRVSRIIPLSINRFFYLHIRCYRVKKNIWSSFSKGFGSHIVNNIEAKSNIMTRIPRPDLPIQHQAKDSDNQLPLRYNALRIGFKKSVVYFARVPSSHQAFQSFFQRQSQFVNQTTELSENLDQGRGEKRANTLFFGFSTSN